MHFNSTLDLVVFIIEVIGVLSFATSGSIKAIQNKVDIIGVFFLTFIEIFGGGLLRDLILSDGIPHIFYDLEYHVLAIIGLIVMLFWFFIGYFKKTAPFIDKHKKDMWIHISDALGISSFCVSGVKVAISTQTYLSIMDQAGSYVLLVSMGVCSGVCGGMLRDICLGEIPSIFKKHFYLTPCLIGCIVYVIMYAFGLNDILSVIVSLILILGLRILAIYFKWNMPSAKGYNEYIKTK